MSRVVRAAGLDRNPLRRRADRVEAWFTLLLTVLLLVGGPVLVWRVGAVGYRDAARAAEQERLLPRFKVSALLQDDPASHLVSEGDTPAQQGPVPARWTAPDGTVHSGAIVPPDGAHAGGAVPLTVDARGNPVAPAVAPDPATSAVSAGVATALGILTVFAVLLLGMRRAFHRRRIASWQLEWLLVERRWSGRR